MKDLIKFLKTVNLEFIQGWSSLLTHQQKTALKKAGVRTPFIRIEGKDKTGSTMYRVPKEYSFLRTVVLPGSKTRVTKEVRVTIK